MTDTKPQDKTTVSHVEKTTSGNVDGKTVEKTLPKEIGGRSGPEPTRYGDWEKNGIISDF